MPGCKSGILKYFLQYIGTLHCELKEIFYICQKYVKKITTNEKLDAKIWKKITQVKTVSHARCARDTGPSEKKPKRNVKCNKLEIF